MVKVNDLATISAKDAKKLIRFGITTSERLLLVAATRIGREDLSEHLDISAERIKGWTQQAEMIQIKGIGGEYNQMLAFMGVDCLQVLRQTNPEELYRSIAQTNYEKQIIRRLPSPQDVERWVKQAKRIKSSVDD